MSGVKIGSRWKIVLLLFLLSLLIQLSANGFQFNQALDGDEIEYHALACRLSGGHGFTHDAEEYWRAVNTDGRERYVEAFTGASDQPGLATAWRTPGIVVIIAVVYKIFGKSYARARLVLLLLTSVTAPLLFLLGANLFQNNLLAGVSVLLWTSLLHTHQLSGSLLGEGVAGTLLVLAIVLIISASSRAVAGSMKTSLMVSGLAGVVVGFLVLVRGYLIFAVIGLFLWLWVQGKKSLAMALLAGFIVLPMFWVARNALTMGVVTLSTESSEVIWLGHNQWTKGSYPGNWKPQHEYLISKYPGFDSLDEKGVFGNCCGETRISSMKPPPIVACR